MSISKYIKIIGRGKEGARALSREDAADLFGQVLDASVTDLEIGGFCLAMRIKGETPAEMAGFLDATHQRLQHIPASDQPIVVLPTYNGARKLPVLTPLLALLLAREGAAVLVHGTPTESSRVFTSEVLAALDIPAQTAIESIASGEVVFTPTGLLCPALKRLLDVRRAVGLRNPAHSLVKIMNPCLGKALVVSSYTHPEYALSMGQTFELVKARELARAQLPPELIATIMAQRQKLAAIVVPDGFSEPVRSALKLAIGLSFVAGFRWVMLLSAGLALLSALSAWLLISAKVPART